MTAPPISAGWHKIEVDLGCAWVWAVPGRPRPGWIACYRSRQDVETGELGRAMLVREDAFRAALIEHIETAGADVDG